MNWSPSPVRSIQARIRFGTVKVEGVLFTNTVKADLAISLLQAFEDQKIIIEQDRAHVLYTIRLFC